MATSNRLGIPLEINFIKYKELLNIWYIFILYIPLILNFKGSDFLISCEIKKRNNYIII